VLCGVNRQKIPADVSCAVEGINAILIGLLLTATVIDDFFESMHFFWGMLRQKIVLQNHVTKSRSAAQLRSAHLAPMQR